MDLCREPDAMTHPDGMQIKVSRQELSRLVGCSREMAGRVLKVLEDQGLGESERQDDRRLQRPARAAEATQRSFATSRIAAYLKPRVALICLVGRAYFERLLLRHPGH